MNLYIFNPDHDLALATDSDHFDAPNSAKIFAEDFACLPCWFAQKNSSVFAKNVRLDWWQNMQSLFPQLQSISLCDSIPKNIDFAFPWGWNKTIRKFLEKQGVSTVPSVEQLNCLRELQHRKWAIEATKYIAKFDGENLRLAPPAMLLQENEIENFVAEHPYSIFKAPWSGSGKGIVRSLGCLSENLLNRVKNMANKQGCVVAEPLYTVIQDFAMEFYCTNSVTKFAGYSWFFTNEHGAYQGNLLASDDYIAEKLSQWISKEQLATIKQRLIEFLDKTIAPNYSGYLGVDMFIYQQNGEIFIHPCVEINLRMTMGLVARLFYDKYVEQGKIGRYFVDYFTNSSELIAEHTKQSENKLIVADGKIQKGYMSLNPIDEASHYRARVEII